MVLCDSEIRRRMVNRQVDDPSRLSELKGLWEDGQWEKIGDNLLIRPYKEVNVGPCCYDLSVGEEFISLREPHTERKLRPGDQITLEPGETVLILTEELVCLPRNLLGMIVPRARWIFEGTALCASRVDPTWHGKLVVALSNRLNYPIRLRQGDRFCTCYFAEVMPVDKPLTRDSTPFLGRTSIAGIEFSRLVPRPLLSPEAVTRDDLDGMVEQYGVPFDVVRGGLRTTYAEAVEYVDSEAFNAIVAEAEARATSKAFDRQQEFNEHVFSFVENQGKRMNWFVGFLLGALWAIAMALLTLLWQAMRSGP